MKPSLTDTLLLALMVALLMVGGHQTFVIGQEEGFKTGFLKSYWIFMIMFVLIVIYQARKNKAQKEKKEESIGMPLKDHGKKNKPGIRQKRK